MPILAFVLMVLANLTAMKYMLCGSSRKEVRRAKNNPKTTESGGIQTLAGSDSESQYLRRVNIEELCKHIFPILLFLLLPQTTRSITF